MSAWHRPDVETAALTYLTQAVGDTTGARQIVDGLLAKGRAGRDVEISAWLNGRARAYRATGNVTHARMADVVESLAQQIGKGAVPEGGERP